MTGRRAIESTWVGRLAPGFAAMVGAACDRIDTVGLAGRLTVRGMATGAWTIGPVCAGLTVSAIAIAWIMTGGRRYP